MLPIRKISPTIVSLSSYYGKTFVQLNPKVSNNGLLYIIRQINLSIVTPGSFISSVALGDVFDNDLKAPFIYNALANQFEGLKTKNGLELFFNHRQREALVGEDVLKQIEKTDTAGSYLRIFVGKTAEGLPVVVGRDNVFYQYGKEGFSRLGEIYDILQIPREKSPVSFSEVRVFSKYIPVGIVLGYYIGIRALLSLLRVNYRVVPARKNKNLDIDEFAIQFKDGSIVIKGTENVAALVMAGFLDFEKVTRLYELEHFDHKEVYLNLLMTKKLGAIYVRELDMMEDCFVDPISKQILEDMKEPTTFKALLVRGTEMLTTYDHPTSQDHAAMRERGYERFSGAVYTELMKAIRQHNNKNMFGKGKIQISPYEIWNSILKDNTNKIAEEINPIQNLKEAEVITFSGNGGRSTESMPKETRAYHINDFGIVSESTVDSAAVGTIAYLSANPNLKNVYGVPRNEKVINPTSVLSTSALLAPCVLTDNPKRIMFVNTQSSHTIPSPSYRQPYVLTGYEHVIGQRTSKIFHMAAKEDGVVTSVSPTGITVTYKSGKTDGCELGTVYGSAEGTTYPHTLQTPLKVGDKFKQGDTVAFNKSFFEPSYSDPSKIIYKTNRCVTVAFAEVTRSHEDSCAISSKISGILKTEVSKVKSFVVEFGQNVYCSLRAGDEVHPDDALMIIEDSISSPHGQFSNTSVETLKRLGSAVSTANVIGTFERIEVYYNGDKEDMTETLKKMADQSDLFFNKRAKSTGKVGYTGKVSEEYRVSGKPLMPGTAEIRVYLKVSAVSGGGDKLIFGHQMKCTISEVINGEILTENGMEVDAIFSYRSVAARGVHSPVLLGTTISLLDVLAERAIKIYGS